MQSLKYDNIDNYEVNDKFKIEILNLEKEEYEENNNNLFSWLSDNFWESKENKKDIKIENQKTLDSENNKTIQEKKVKEEKVEKDIENKVEFIDSREEIKLTNIENEILKKFNKYDLKQVDLHPRLFDLTWEYPDKYFEYYAKDLNLYFFGNKTYLDLKDIFNVLTYELPFSINEVNNFWTSSFYINLDTLFEDDYIRIVIEKSNRTFWLKIKKQLYEQIKNDLSVIFHK